MTSDFSVLIPVYFKEKPEFLDSALQSTFNQTLVPGEVVIVKDGPLTPELDAVLENFSRQYPGKMTILGLAENQGAGIALATGLKHCKYDIVARMDSDDLAVPTRFEKQLTFLNEHPEIDLVGSLIEEFLHEPGDLNRVRRVPEKHNDVREFAKQRSPVNHISVVMRKKAAIESGSYWSKRVLEDYYLWYNMLLKGYKFHNIQERLLYARVGNNMVGRRKGMYFLKNELDFFNTMRKDKFITSFEFYKFSLIRTILRMMPTAVLNFIYKHFLRN